MQETFQLLYPFSSPSGQRIDVLQLRRLQVKDIRAARRISSKPEDWDETLIAAMTGLLPEDLAEMDLSDWQSLQTRFQQMLGVDETAGNTLASDGSASSVV
ncbi:mu-like prophage FluMu gp41 family protein [Obesumbacterium proteus]|uniref:phage tail assembly protein n=1 Tax=Obesumbacterium proteus TaxID=82983 RepID=UPI0006221F08|nr:phage tail assembly protein [Obesumbacterium proteus]KKI46739.1 mu-like prophage FluMu gp41 family protein [Obesumbacterium proteus]